MDNNYKRTVAGSVGAGMGAIFNASGRKFYILEHKTDSAYHHAGESQKIIVDQIELGRDSSCQVRFDEAFETVSRRHAAIVRDGEGWKLIALSQTNATLVNGQPIDGEWHLSSGDEIRLSSKGPLMGFIIPQGKTALTNSIGLTERMNLFRQQALRPYKVAVAVMAVVFALALAGLAYWIFSNNQKVEAANKAEQEVIAAAEAAEKNWFSDIEKCYDAVYYVRMDNLVVYDPENQEVVTFNTSDIIGGTGFLLEDGRFVTARRVVEPWYYYKSRIGRDSNGIDWTFKDIQVLANLGYKVVANYTAYSPSGANFKFISTEMSTSRPTGDIENERYGTSTNNTLSRLVGRLQINLDWYNTNHQTDWATMAKKDQTSIVKGLKFDNEASREPKVQSEVKILGYPLMEGFVDSGRVKPTELTNNVNVTGLNDEGVIELASRRYQKGNNGAPILVKNNEGLWVVVGVLCETDAADRDVVVPIDFIK